MNGHVRSVVLSGNTRVEEDFIVLVSVLQGQSRQLIPEMCVVSA